MALSRTSVNNFSSLLIDDLIDTFGLKIKNDLSFPASQIGQNLVDFLVKFNSNIKIEIDYWNEQELIMKHIAPIINAVEIYGEHFNTFAERCIAAKLGDFELAGIVDFVVAKGKYNPSKPYFFIQEYKKNKQGPNSDPFAQLLGEMLVAQKLNEETVVYGCYIIGKFWYFVILENYNYNQESPLNSTETEDLEVIMSKLNWIKQYVENKLK